MFDTTGVGTFTPAKGFQPDAAALNTLLEKNRSKVKVTKVEEIEAPKALAKWEVTIAGMA